MNNINSNPTFEKRTIGDCTLYLGDSLELLAAGVFGKIGAIVSDPPYGIGYQHNGGKMLSKVTYANKTITQSNTAAVIGDDVPFDPQPLLDAAPCVVDVLQQKTMRMLVERSVKEPLFVGFVENDAVVSQAAGLDVKGYFVTIPGDVPRHAETSHGYDGRGQRPAMPPDYERVRSVLNEADSIRAGDLNRNGNATVVASKKIGLETYRAVFEVLPGKRNRALALLSLVIKTPK